MSASSILIATQQFRPTACLPANDRRYLLYEKGLYEGNHIESLIHPILWRWVKLMPWTNGRKTLTQNIAVKVPETHNSVSCLQMLRFYQEPANSVSSATNTCLIVWICLEMFRAQCDKFTGRMYVFTCRYNQRERALGFGRSRQLRIYFFLKKGLCRGYFYSHKDYLLQKLSKLFAWEP